MLFIGEIDGFELHLSIQNECDHCDKQVFIEKHVKNSVQIGFIKLPQGKRKGVYLNKTYLATILHIFSIKTCLLLWLHSFSIQNHHFSIK